MRQRRSSVILVVLGLVLAGTAVWAAPPPWALAHGYRKKRVVVYQAVPFVYSGVTYLPLRDVASLIGAALLWDDLRDRAVLTYSGREIGLVVGSPTVYWGTEVVVLPRAPLVVHDVVYVPATFCEHYLRVPVTRSRGVVVLKGPHGPREFGLASSPPGRISFGKAGKKASVGLERGRARSRAQGPAVRPHKAAERGRARAKVRAQGRPERPAGGRGHAGAKGDGGKGHGRGK